MKRDFLAELKATIRRINEPERPAVVPSVKLKTRRFNIHKRSLPPGIDKIVVFNMSKLTAVWWVEKILKARAYQFAPEDSKTLVYYDIVPVNATPRERSIYFNEGPTILE